MIARSLVTRPAQARRADRRHDVPQPARLPAAPGVLPFLAAVALSGVVGCGGAGPGPSIPTPVNGFRPEDRVVLGDFTRVNALASAQDRVYVVYQDAVVVWHPLERRWDVPRSPPVADRLRTVTAAVVDPLDRSLWLSTPTGPVHYDPLSNRWDDGLPPPRRLRPPVSLNDAMRDLPQLRAMAPHIAMGRRQLQGVLTAAAPDPLGRGWYLGTSVRGLVFLDRMASDATPIPLGLSSELVSAIAPAGDGIWVATDADMNRPADLALLASDLSQSTPVADQGARGLPFSAVRRLLVAGGAIWAATDQGLIRWISGGNRIDRFDAGNGLPDPQVLSLAMYRGGIVAGTAHGLAWLRGDTGFVRIAPGFTEPVYALLSRGDTLWTGTSRGLFAALPGNDDLRMPEGFRQLTDSRVPIVGLGYIGDTLVAMTQDRLFWRDPASGGWNAGPVLGGQLGTLVALDATAQGAWVAGTRGVGFVRPATYPLRMLVVPGQLPGEVTAVAAQGELLWIGTRLGLVRYRLELQ